MQEKVVNYIETIFELECDAQTLYNQEGRWEEYNQALAKMNDYVPDVFSNKFDMIPLREPKSPSYYEEVKEWVLKRRKLYKVSKYVLEADIYYLCYISAFNARHNMIGNCWVCKIKEDRPFLYSSFILLLSDEDEPLQWIVGAQDLDINKFRNPIESKIYNETNIIHPILQDIIDNR
jgi:hypothetical protein